MRGKSRWTRWFAVLLVAALLPVGQFAGIPILQASAQNGGLLELRDWGLNANGNGAWFDWDNYHDGDQYELSVRLYRMPDLEPIEGADVYLSYNGSQPHLEVKLPPGSYKIVLELKIDEQVAAEDEQYFTLTGVPLNIYLFGADADTQVELFNGWDEYVVPLARAEAFDGYVRYTYEVYPVGYYRLTSPSHPSFGEQSIYPEEQQDFVFHLEQPDYTVMLGDYDITLTGGSVRGNIWFHGWEQLYRLVFVDQNGSVLGACLDEIESVPGSEMGIRTNFQCDMPSGAKSLRMDAVADGFVFPTNALWHLDDIALPGLLSAEDLDDGMETIELTAQFEDSEDAAEVSLYKVQTPSSYDIRYFEPGQGIYDFALAGYSYPGDRLIIEMIAADGYPYAKRAVFPLNDNISVMVGNIDFACGGNNSAGTASWLPDPSQYYCLYFERFNDEIVPENTEFAGGTVSWTLPDTGDLELMAYDLYYADENLEIIRGDVRVNSPELYGTGSFAYSLPDAPQDAAYVAVVTLLTEWDEFDPYPSYYFAQPFFVPIGEEQPPQEEEPDELVQGSELIPLEDGSYGYIPKGMTAGMVMDKFQVAAGAEMMIQNGNNKPGLFDPVTPGSILIVTLGERREEIRLRFLSELLRPSGTEPVTAAHVTVFVIAQLAAADPVDLTGDGIFNQDDVRLLLGEL